MSDAMVLVYRFKYWSRTQNEYLEADDFATQKAIHEIGARLLSGTAKAVHPSLISRAGYLIKPIS
jgi:hypothetical protein